MDRYAYSKLDPFRYPENDIFTLYGLYEHNHDFRLLHYIITQRGGEHFGECMEMLREECMQKHPRGLLHAAGYSTEAREMITEMLALGGWGWNSYGRSQVRTFRLYCRRVASDRTDPLRHMASRMLEDAHKMGVKPLSKMSESAYEGG